MTNINGYRANAVITGDQCVVTTAGALRGSDTNLASYDHFKVTPAGWLTGYWPKHLNYPTASPYYRDALVQVPFRKFTVVSATKDELVLQITPGSQIL